MSTKARFGIGAAAAVTAALAVSGCSGGGGGPAGANGTATAASGQSAAMSLVSDVMSKASSAGTVKIQGTVSSANTGSLTLSGEEQYSPSVKLSLTMQIESQQMSEVLIGSTFYLDYPALSAQMGGKPWGRIDLAQAGGELGSLSTLADSAKNYNPTTQIEALIASGKVTKNGTATVDGVQATHYSGHLNAGDLLQQTADNAGLTASQFKALQSTLQTAGISSESIDLWVGSDGLPVEIKYAAQSTAAGEVDTDMHLSDWGKPVQIGAPPASQVFDLTTQMIKAQASASAGGL